MKYYKITNESENHYGFQFRTGLNVDTKPFNPSGDCEPGGIYFAREDILTFLSYGVWLREVTIPEDAMVYENPGNPKKWKADRVMLGKRERITAHTVKRLLEEGAYPKAGDSGALRWAAENGHKEIVELLIPVSDPKADDSSALRWAAASGHKEIVELLIPVSYPKADGSCALRWATENGHKEIVELLIPVSDPKAYASSALRWAAEKGHKEIVELLIPVSDPKAYASSALEWAAKNGHKEIVELLIPVSDPAVVEALRKRGVI